MTDQSKEIVELQDKVDNLRWRMNSVCNFLSRNFPDLIDGITSMYMKEETKVIEQPESKYKIGDVVWVKDSTVNNKDRIGCDFFRGIIIPTTDRDKNLSEPYVRIKPISNYMGGEYSSPQSYVYPSREALMESQIQYWNKLNCEDGRHEMIERYGAVNEMCTWCDYQAPYNKPFKPKEIYKTRNKDFAKVYSSFCDKLINDTLADTGIQIADKECQHDADILSCNQQYELYRIGACETKYYTDTKTNEITCECGIDADFPHECKCKKCGEVF